MTVRDFAQILRHRWKIICLVTAVAILGAIVQSLLASPRYEASTRLFVSTTSEGNNSQTYDGGLFAQGRVLSYIELLTGDILAQRTVDKLGLDMSATDLKEKIEATAPTDTVLIDVTVTDSSASRARDIANTLSDEFVVMAAGLETPQLGAQPNARVIVQERAELPEDPVAPKTKRNLAIAAVLGALVGVFLALVRERLDDRIRSSAALEKSTGVGLVADIPFDAERRRNPLIAFETDHSAAAEAFRELRVNVKFQEIADGPRTLLVASAMPEEGRTTTAVNLALALAEAGHDVVVVDGDLRRPRVAQYLGLGGQAGLATVLSGSATLDDALQRTHAPRLTAITSGAAPSNPAELLESQVTKDVVAALGQRFDYVILDSPSLLRTDAAILAASCQGVLVVARFGTTKRRQLTDAVHTLTRAGAPLLGAVLTFSPARKRSTDDYYSSADVSATASQARGGRWRRGSHTR
ncbi:polysaccharide biosynthesis tyrosine autokinase [Mycolicibacterium sp. S2-37]|uniref:polysaccharide biosynthesis tyrosine autokinase n=1 Tax=Mycolicibacterium sp. S2-37 TaxID=2810297 RepID=UPI001F5ECC02|nr:polysaccharide biosynthesis tyrosine autokinase [Mycolicibacterium sp. S2-37]